MWQEKGVKQNQLRESSWWWNKARSEIVYACMKKTVHCKSKILDIGAGYGCMVAMLQKFGTVTAVEPYRDAAEYLSEQFNIRTFNTTLDAFNVNEQYNIITCFDVLEHIHNDRQALIKMQSLLMNDGLLVLTVPAYQFLWSKHDELNHHYRRYTIKGLIEKLPGSFIVRKITYFNTIMFTAALLDKVLFSKNKPSYALNPNRIIDMIFYRIFSLEKHLLPYINFPFGTSILLMANKKD